MMAMMMMMAHIQEPTAKRTKTAKDLQCTMDSQGHGSKVQSSRVQSSVRCFACDLWRNCLRPWPHDPASSGRQPGEIQQNQRHLSPDDRKQTQRHQQSTNKQVMITVSEMPHMSFIHSSIHTLIHSFISSINASIIPLLTIHLTCSFMYNSSAIQ